MTLPDSSARPAPSADEQALLAAVVAHPDEDTPRLIYADWLDEHAGALAGRDPKEMCARAEFIRAQVEITRLPLSDPNSAVLRARVVQLAARHRKRWCEESSAVFVRGFPIAVQLYNLFTRDTEDLLARYPIRVLYAQNAFPPDIEEERASTPPTFFPQLTGLGSFSRGWGGHRVAHVLANPLLANLRMLDFYCGSYNRAEGARGIAAATHLRNLLVLGLSGNEIGDEGLEALASAKHLSSLRALRLGADLSGGANNITEEGVTALARSQCFPSLTQLALDGNAIGANGVEQLLQAEWIGNLTELNLADSALSERGLLALARSTRLPNLRRLDVATNEVTDAIALAFLQSTSFPKLTDLHLIGYYGLEQFLTEATQAALRQRFGRGVISEKNYHSHHAPTPLCLEDKIRWRIISDDPPAPTEDCEAI